MCLYGCYHAEDVKFLFGLVWSIAGFENDVRARSELKVGGAREALSAHENRKERKELERMPGEGSEQLVERWLGANPA